MATISQNLQTIANGLDTIKDNLGLSASASLSDVVTKSASVIEPTGTISITENGTVNVTNYASANVEVSGGGGGPITQEEYNIDEELARSILQDFIPYTELEYIESTGTQYINTGYLPNQNTKIDIVMESIDWGSYKNPFGVRTGNNSGGSWVYTNRFASWLYSSKENVFQIGYDGRIVYTTTRDYTATKFNLVIDNGNIYIKDLSHDYAAETFNFTPVGNFTADYGLLLGAMTNDGTSVWNLCKFKLYSCKIYEGATLVKDYIPAINRATSGIGLYEKIGGTFLYNPRSRRIRSGRCCKCQCHSLIHI